MKTMTKERFFKKDITCAVVISVEDGTAKLQDVMLDDKSGYCFDVKLYKNADIMALVKKHSVNEKEEGSYEAPKIEITTEPLTPRKDNFPYYTATLEMTTDEFNIFKNNARDGLYLIALTNTEN